MQKSGSHLNPSVQGRNLTAALAGNVLLMAQSITSLRRTLRQLRNNIPPATRRRFDFSIHQNLLDSGILLRSGSLAGYFANDGEPSIDLLLQALTKRNRPYHLPVLKKQKLIFKSYVPGDPLKHNAFNILEPTCEQYITAKYLSAILMPLVGFDHQGNRLGMGGGYYDRTLNFMRNPLCKKAPLLIGVAYSLQAVETLHRQPWDIPLDAVITEDGLTCFSAKARQLLRST